MRETLDWVVPIVVATSACDRPSRLRNSDKGTGGDGLVTKYFNSG